MNKSIKILRENKGFSQTYLAGYLNISRQMYIKYENGEVEPPVKIIRDLCSLYSVTYDVIIDDKVNNYINNNDTSNINAHNIDSAIKDNSYSKATYNISPVNTYHVAEPETSYTCSNITSNIVDNQLYNLISKLKKLPKKYIPSVSAFIRLLEQEDKASTNTKNQSKQAFFELAGKIELDSNDVNSFRKESLI